MFIFVPIPLCKYCFELWIFKNSFLNFLIQFQVGDDATMSSGLQWGALHFRPRIVQLLVRSGYSGAPSASPHPLLHSRHMHIGRGGLPRQMLEVDRDSHTDNHHVITKIIEFNTLLINISIQLFFIGLMFAICVDFYLHLRNEKIIVITIINI